MDDPEDSPDAGATVWPIWRYFYDGSGNQVAIVDPKGRITRFWYDALGRQTRRYMPYATGLTAADLKDPAWYPALGSLPGIPTGQPYEQSWYDAHGRVVKRKDCKGPYTVYRYYVNDPAGPDRFMDGVAFLGRPGPVWIEAYCDGDPQGGSQHTF